MRSKSKTKKGKTKRITKKYKIQNTRNTDIIIAFAG